MAAITLTVDFDIHQISQRLNWAFEAPDQPPIPPGTGMNTGLIPFKQGDTMTLVVQGNSIDPGLPQLESLEIVDAYFITSPILYSKRAHPLQAGEYPAPSPFQGRNAVISVGGGVASGTPSQMTWQADGALECRNLGRWEASLILTAKITTADGVMHRVFSFDPECEVGTGA
jgi:hypothetical protein